MKVYRFNTKRNPELDSGQEAFPMFTRGVAKVDEKGQETGELAALVDPESETTEIDGAHITEELIYNARYIEGSAETVEYRTRD